MHSVPTDRNRNANARSYGRCARCGRTLKREGVYVELLGTFGPECAERAGHLVTALQARLNALGLGALLTPEGVTFPGKRTEDGWVYSAEMVAFRDRLIAENVHTRCGSSITSAGLVFTYRLKVDEALFACLERKAS